MVAIEARNVMVAVSVLGSPALGVPAPWPIVARRKSRISSGARMPGALCMSCDEKSLMTTCSTSKVPKYTLKVVPMLMVTLRAFCPKRGFCRRMLTV